MTTSSVTNSTNPYASLGIAIGNTSSTSGTSASGAAATGGGAQSLNMDSFMTLLTTQLQNQDPTNPMDNSQMVAQLAQFSSLEGINQLNTTVSGFQSTLQANQVMQAASLVGKAAIVKGSTGYLYNTQSSNGTTTASGMIGAVDIPTGATSVSVNITNSAGQVVKTLAVPTTGNARPTFSWDGNMPDGSPAPAGTYSISANATVNGQGQAAQTYVGAVIQSVGVTSSGPQLNLDGGLPPAQLSDVVEIIG
ncbi:flagellar hook assembly protein FlgD [Halothiobacillus sp. DCM-1]|uniref:flagellar hook assembly protein FlgD n=1 Tax=Halothiobacillus sp. DCM-1 TaxID=3112558 RepID=UPI0032436A50